jgi:hypothetical protein
LVVRPRPCEEDSVVVPFDSRGTGSPSPQGTGGADAVDGRRLGSSRPPWNVAIGLAVVSATSGSSARAGNKWGASEKMPDARLSPAPEQPEKRRLI